MSSTPRFHLRPSPTELLTLWQQTMGYGEQRIVAFANAVLDAALIDPNEHRETLDTLSLPTHTYNALRRAGLVYVDQLSWMSKLQLLSIKGIGEGGVRWIEDALAGKSKLCKPTR